MNYNLSYNLQSSGGKAGGDGGELVSLLLKRAFAVSPEKYHNAIVRYSVQVRIIIQWAYFFKDTVSHFCLMNLRFRPPQKMHKIFEAHMISQSSF